MNEINKSCPVKGLTPQGQALVKKSRNSELKMLLPLLPEYANLTTEDVRELFFMKEKEILLNNYTFPTVAGKDGYYRIYVKDATKKSGRKQLFAKTLDELKDKVYQFEKGITGRSRKTFRDAFFLVQDEKIKYIKNKEKLLSVQNTIGRTKTEYKRFFNGTDFEKKFVDEITKKDIENVVFMNLQRYDLKKKAFSSMKGILKSVFELAYEEYWISDNVYLRVNFTKYNNMLMEEVDIKNRCHSNDDLSRIIDYLHEYQKKKPKYIPAYALELQILMGARRGEIPPLDWASITDDYILIAKEQLTVKRNGGNVKEHCVIVNHTKTYKDRKFPRTDAINDFLERLEQVHKKYYPNSEYLFPADNENGIITNNTAYNFYRRMLKKLGIEVSAECIKGTHSFRRNAITDVVNATNGNIIMASQLFGNSPEVAKKNYYTEINFSEATNALNKRHLS